MIEDKRLHAIIEAVFTSEQFKKLMEEYQPLYANVRQGDELVVDNGYGPGGDRSEIRINIRDIVETVMNGQEEIEIL